MSRILITGASGFIGAHLLEHLCAQGHDVTAVSRNGIDAPSAARWVQADLGDAAAVDQLFTQQTPDVVYHLASHVTGRRDIGEVLPMLEANLNAAVRVLSAATHTGCTRVVLAGSMEEPDPASAEPSGSPYAAAKAAQTLYARFFHALYGTPAVVARIFMVYGPGQRDLQKVIPYAVLRGLDGAPAELRSAARPVDWIYVDDVVRGLASMGTANGIDGLSIDLGSGIAVTVGDMVRCVADQIGSPSPLLDGGSPRELETARCADVARTFSLLGFRAEMDIGTGLHHTIDWYRAEREAGRL